MFLIKSILCQIQLFSIKQLERPKLHPLILLRTMYLQTFIQILDKPEKIIVKNSKTCSANLVGNIEEFVNLPSTVGILILKNYIFFNKYQSEKPLKKVQK